MGEKDNYMYIIQTEHYTILVFSWQISQSIVFEFEKSILLSNISVRAPKFDQQRCLDLPVSVLSICLVCVLYIYKFDIVCVCFQVSVTAACTDSTTTVFGQTTVSAALTTCISFSSWSP